MNIGEIVDLAGKVSRKVVETAKGLPQEVEVNPIKRSKEKQEKY